MAGVSAGEDCMLLTPDTLAFAARDTGRTTDVTVASAAADKPYEMMEAAQSGTANATLGTITDDDATSTAMSPLDAELGVDFRGARRRYGDSGAGPPVERGGDCHSYSDGGGGMDAGCA